MSYFESRLPVNFNDLHDIQRRLSFCEEIGIKNIILEAQKDITRIPLSLKNRIKEKTDINIYYRINLRINNLEECKKYLSKYNTFSDIISIESLNKEVQLYAAKDSRVDIISFSDQEILKTLSPGVISLTKQNKSFIEFSLESIMEKNKIIQSKNLRNVYKFVLLAQKLKANYILSGNFKNLFDYRHPRALISICHTILDLPLDITKMIFSRNPRLLLEKIRMRNSKNLERGLKLIKGGC